MKYHYESVVDAFAASGDMAGAFKIFAIMEESGLTVSRPSTRTIFQAMMEDPNLIGDAVLAMREMVDSHKRVHPEALCVTLEAMVRSDPRGTSALSLYDDWTLLTGQEPSLDALRDLLVSSYDAQTVYKLTKDYTARIGEVADYENPKLYDRAIKECVDRGDFDIAFNLAQRNIDASKNIKKGKRKQLWRGRLYVPYLVDKALAAQDDRVWGIVDSVNEVQDEMTENVASILTRRKMAAKIAKATGKPEGEVWKQSGDGEVVDLIGPKSPVKESLEVLEKLFEAVSKQEESEPSIERVSERVLKTSKKASRRTFGRALGIPTGGASRKASTPDLGSRRASGRPSRDAPRRTSKSEMDSSDPFTTLKAGRKTY